MMTPLDLVIFVLATYRLSLLLEEGEGPFGLLDAFRYAVGCDVVNGKWVGYNNFARGLLCPYCNSVWIGVAFTVLHVFFPTISLIIATPFALSGAVVLKGN